MRRQTKATISGLIVALVAGLKLILDSVIGIVTLFSDSFATNVQTASERLFAIAPFLAESWFQGSLTIFAIVLGVFAFCLRRVETNSVTPSNERRVAEKGRVVREAREELESAIAKIAPNIARSRRQVVDSIKPCITILKSRLREEYACEWRVIEDDCQRILSTDETTTEEFRELARDVIIKLNAIKSRLSNDMLR